MHILSWLLVPAVAFADSPTAESPPEAASVESRHSATVTLSAINLLKPVISRESVRYGPEVEVMGEGRLSRRFSIAGSLAFGVARIDLTDDELLVQSLMYSLQGLSYPVGRFERGMQAGIEFSQTRIFGATEVEGIAVNAVGTGTSVAGLIGYKTITPSGFTFVGQIGGGPRVITARASGGGETQVDREQSAKIILNANVGWSF